MTVLAAYSSYENIIQIPAGVIQPPYFEVANEKIAIRHLYACAFAFFWRHYPDYFKSVKDFFDKEPSGPDLFYDFLNGKPQELLEMLLAVIPDEIKNNIHLLSSNSIEEFISIHKIKE